MTQRTWNTILNLGGMVLGWGVLLMIVWTVFFTGCGGVTRAPIGDSWGEEEAEGDMDAPEDVLEVLDAPEADEGPEEDLVEVVEDTAEEDVGGDEAEEPCEGPERDCDGDGRSPVGGDCCDSNPDVHPLQEGWFGVPYHCPDLSWDYDCDGEVLLEVVETLGAPMDEIYLGDCWGLNLTDCRNSWGWRDPPPACGEEGELVDCDYVFVGPVGHCEPDESDSYTGTIRCH